jgi:hypothetical protein
LALFGVRFLRRFFNIEAFDSWYDLGLRLFDYVTRLNGKKS